MRGEVALTLLFVGFVAYGCGATSSRYADDDDDRGSSGEGGDESLAGQSSGGEGGSSTRGGSSGKAGGAAGATAGREGGGRGGGGNRGGSAAAAEGGDSPTGGTTATEAGAAGQGEAGTMGVSGEGGAPEKGVFDLVQDFSATTNPTPTGHFSFGWKAALDGAFSLYTTVGQSLGDARITWQRSSTLDYLMVGFNPSSSTLGDEPGNPGMTAFFHPGAGGEISVVRWTCPKRATYSVAATFTPRDATTSTVYFVMNDTLPEQFSSGISTIPTAFYEDVALEAGDTLDFCVDYGFNHDYQYDNTGIDVMITEE